MEESISNDAANGPRHIGDEGTAGWDADAETCTQHGLLGMQKHRACLQMQNFCSQFRQIGYADSVIAKLQPTRAVCCRTLKQK